MKDKEIEFSPYDTAEFLRTPEEIADFLEAIFEYHGDEPKTIIKALGTVARAQGMLKIAKSTGLQRQGLYKSFSEAGNPSFETVLKVMNAVGMDFKPVRRRKIRMAQKKAKPRSRKAAA